MTTRRLLPIAALLAVAALAGCGGSDGPSADDAQSAYASVRTQIVGLGGSIGRAIGDARSQSDRQLADAFTQLQERGRAAVARLQAIDVPGDLQDERQALGDAVEQGSNDLADIADAARRSDAAAARDAVQQLITDSRAIAAARHTFEQALDDATS